MKITGIITLLMLAAQMAFAGFGEINGRVTEASNGEPIIGAYVYVEVDSQVIYQGVSDNNGYYVIKPIESGTYNVRVSTLTFSQQLIKNVPISDGQIRKLDFALSVNELEVVEVITYKDMVQSGYAGTIAIIPATEIERSAAAPIDFISAVSASVYQEDYGAPIQFRGARPEGTLYFVDGVKIIGEPVIVRNSVEDILVYTGGIPAKYGDATGGIIVITTKSYNKIR